MISDELGVQLHDRWTRGESLTEEEMAQLAGWYEVQDEAERKLLNIPDTHTDLVQLQAQVDEAVAELAQLTKFIQEKTAENNALRRDIAALRQQLASQIQPA
ncbi:MAG TPA: hypothetical protein PLD25_03915 [Chloroflexota bacterium]|nr:hypothetical protein [Chloroflexota bacterium]